MIKNKNPKKILVINTFGIGDALFTMPFVDNLKVNFPQASIDYVSNRRTVEIIGKNKNIDRMFIYERDASVALSRKSKWEFLKKVREFLSELKRQHYDIVFDFSLNSNINFFTALIGIKERIGLNYKKRSPFLTFSVPFAGFENKHVIEHYLDLLDKLNLKIETRKLHLDVDPKDKKWAEDFLNKNGRDKGKRLIGVLPGGGASWGKEARFRRWAPAKFAKLVDKMVEKLSAQIILIGDINEKDLCRQLEGRHEKDVIKAYGQTTLGQLSALLSMCDLFVLNDGGPLHVAVAVGIKTVSIFGPVDHRVYGPYLYGEPNKHIVVAKTLFCQPCYRKFRMTQCSHISCLDQITVDDVFRKVEQAL